MKKLSADEILSQAANTHYKQRKDGLMKRIVGAYKVFLVSHRSLSMTTRLQASVQTKEPEVPDIATEG